MGDTPTQETPRPAYIETASATTDPDNANSGNTAYIICAVVVVALIAIGSLLGSALTTLLRMEAAGALGSSSNLGGIDGYEDGYGYHDLFDDDGCYELDGGTYRVRPGSLE